MRYRKGVAAVAILILTACATTKGFEALLSSWVGSSISEYIATNAVSPAQVVEATGGGKIYIFQYASTSYYTTPTDTAVQATTYGNTVYGTATTTGGQTIPINQQCNWTFTTDAEGIIRSWSWRGNACRL
jgi:hypothetical protein